MPASNGRHGPLMPAPVRRSAAPNLRPPDAHGAPMPAHLPAFII
jgi:hypothetical protein